MTTTAQDCIRSVCFDTFVGFAATGLCILASIAACDSAAAEVPSPAHPGEAVYKKMCIDCHGAMGEGVAEKYDDPLVGTKSLPSLVKYIARAMPEGKEGTCVGADAENVAAYIYDTFYSPAAQARNNPVRESLTRLTAPQYQQSVADLLGSFRGGAGRPIPERRGLTGKYSGKFPRIFGPQLPRKGDVLEEKARNRNVYEKIDQEISFSFGTESPNPVELRADDFEIRWDGALRIPETGFYEFVVRTENGFRLYINSPEDPLIDSWVTPGPTVREERKSILLLGGRTYPVALQYFKYKEKSASIQLLWKPPHGRLVPIPPHVLIPEWAPVVAVTGAEFPADDRSDGYERGTTISKEWDQATTRSALEVAAHVEEHLDALAVTKAGDSDRVDKLKAFARRFVETAFRRPLTPELADRFVAPAFASAPTPEIAIKRVVILALKSPRFLYPDASHLDSQDDWRVATRLALALWDSLPDAGLVRAAAEGRLRTREQVAAEARRMLPDPRTKSKLRGFFHHWLELDRAENATKDSQAFPDFDASMMADLRESLWRFIDDVVWSAPADYRQLVAADYLWLNERLGNYYGRPVQGDTFQKIAFDPAERSGVITHPYLLASLSYSRTSSPIHRGVFLSRNIVGLALKNPSVAVAFEDAKFDPTLTMREKVTEITKNASCMGCHSSINPLGFTLEHFDAVGRWRTKDNNKPINARDQFDNDEGRTITVTGPRDVANYALSSPSAHRAFVRQLFHHTVKQPTAAFGPDTLETLTKQFAERQFNIRDLLAEIAVIGSLPAPAATPPGQPPKKLATLP